jgi:hypothetical protein
MKKLIKISIKSITVLILLMANIGQLMAQTDGITYQAVIINPKAQEVPGVDKIGNILPNAVVAIRFTILDATNAEEFTETQITKTDQFGMINLVIGSINHEDFTRISWDGTTKDLKVEIDFNGTGSSFLDLSRQKLLFVPYAYHRNITATGTLTVDQNTHLNAELIVEGPTNLNSSLDVNNNNNTNLSGRLNVEGATVLNNTLLVSGKTDLLDSLSVNQSPSLFDGNITVEDTATFNGPALFNAPVNFIEITVNGPSYLNGQVTLNANLDTVGGETNYQAYPLLVQGSSQGIAIKVNGSRSAVNNYVSFWDNETGEMWGRIEGQTVSDLNSDPEYAYDIASLSVSIAIATVDFAIAGFEVAQAGVDLVAASSSSTACVGFGACVTAPIPAFIISAGTNLALKIANAVSAGTNMGMAIADLVTYEDFRKNNIGVTYQSGAGDYAEWLPKANSSEKFKAGDIVGVRNGFVTKSTSGADRMMVVSTNPIVLGNMPKPNEEANYEKIAFMGQVPIRVIGDVEPGDYILPSLIVEGFGTAVHPDKMKITDYKKIVGVAWNVTKGVDFNFVNLAVGLNTNDLSTVIQKQQQKLEELQGQINRTNEILANLVPGFKEAMEDDICITEHTISEKALDKKEKKTTHNEHNHGLLQPNTDDIVYITPTRDQLLESLEQAKAIYLQSGKSLDEHPFWKKINNEPEYKEEILLLMESKFDKALHTHKSINKKFSE